MCTYYIIWDICCSLEIAHDIDNLSLLFLSSMNTALQFTLDSLSLLLNLHFRPLWFAFVADRPMVSLIQSNAWLLRTAQSTCIVVYEN
jgi:hypothetical protein